MISIVLYLLNKDAQNVYLHVVDVLNTYSQNGVIYIIIQIH